MSPVWQFAIGVSDDESVVTDIVAMQIGEAMGHGVWADAQTLELTASLGNASGRGIKGRFGHPGMSENATGKQITVNRNFHVDGDKLRHDAHLHQPARKSPAFSRDPIAYILDVAKTDPASMGESVVIDSDTVWPLSDGREIAVIVGLGGDYYYPDGKPDDITYTDGRPDTALTPLPALRPVSLFFVDLVNEGALTPDGMFSSGGSSIWAAGANEYAFELFSLIDEWRERYRVRLDEIPDKVDGLLTKYLATRAEAEEIYPMAKTTRARRKTSRALSAGEGDAATETEIILEEGEAVDPVVEAEQPTGQDDQEEEATGDADALLTELEADIAEEPADDADGALASQLAQVASDVAVLSETMSAQIAVLEGQSKKIDALESLLERGLQVSAALSRNIKRIEGDRVVTRVLQPASNPIDALEDADAPRPVAASGLPVDALAFSRPTHTSDRQRQADPMFVAPDDFSPEAAMKRMARLERVVSSNGGAQ